MRFWIMLLYMIFYIFTSEVCAEVLKLTVKEALRLAIEKNLDVRTELYNPVIAQADVIKNLGIYDTLFNLTANYQDSSTFQSDLTLSNDQKTLKLTPGVSQLLPTGGSIALAFNNSKIETNSTYAIYPDYWQSDVTLSLTQPLLKNFGKETTELNILVAEKVKDGSIKRFTSKVQSIVSQVKIEYFKLHSLREDLTSKTVSLNLAKRILNETQDRVSAGMLPPMEVLNAEFGVASREKEVIDAEKALRDQIDLLRQVLQIKGKIDIYAVDAPILDKFFADEDDAIRKALSLRPEIDELKFQLAAAEIQNRVSESRTKPDLNLNASYAMTGLGDKYDRNMDRVGSVDYPVWTVGIQLQYPLGNRSAEGEAEKSRLKVEQTKCQLENLTSVVITEVQVALRWVESSFKQLEVTNRGRSFAEERLKAYISKNAVGLATTKDVLDVENDLATARTNQIKAQVTYAAAVTQFLKATGEILEKEGITVNGKTIAELLSKK